MWMCGIGPMCPKCAFGDQKGPHLEKKNTSFNGGVLGPKNGGFLGVFWTECEGADLNQRQGIATMDHRNKIQSLALPTHR